MHSAINERSHQDTVLLGMFLSWPPDRIKWPIAIRTQILDAGHLYSNELQFVLHNILALPCDRRGAAVDPNSRGNNRKALGRLTTDDRFHAV